MGDLEQRLSDKIEDAKAAEELRAGRTRHPDGPEIIWDKGKTLEVRDMPVPEGTSADRALLRFLEDAMGDDSYIAEALDLSKLSFSLMYDAGGVRKLSWIKCPVDRDKIRPADLREQAARFVEEIGRQRPRKKPDRPTGYTTDDLWCLGDLQLGKECQDFGGLARTQKRVGWFIDERLPDHTGTTKKQGKVDKIHIALLGDLTEGCMGSYDQQQWTTVLNTAEQFRAAQHLVTRMIERALKLAHTVEVSAVASNHDQNARGLGKKNVTDHWDDRSWMLMDALSLAFTKPEHQEIYHERVSFLVPENPLVAGFKMRDTVVATAHGHEMNVGGGSAQEKVNRWWREQIASRKGAAAAAQILIAAHYHHWWTLADGGRFSLGTPAGDGGSRWLHDGKGTWSLPGFATLKFDDLGFKGSYRHTWPEDRRRAAELGVVAA